MACCELFVKSLFENGRERISTTRFGRPPTLLAMPHNMPCLGPQIRLQGVFGSQGRHILPKACFNLRVGAASVRCSAFKKEGRPRHYEFRGVAAVPACGRGLGRP